MNLISKKNLGEGEVIIYQPRTHWIVLVRPFLLMLLSLLFYGILWLLRDFDPATAELMEPAMKGILIVNGTLTACVFVLQLFRYLVTEYYLTNKRLILKKGLFSMTLLDMPIDEVESIRCRQSLFGAVFRYGTVGVTGEGGTRAFCGAIRRPFTLRHRIYEVREKNKRVTVIRNEKPRTFRSSPGTPAAQDVPGIEYGVFVKSYPAEAGITE